MTDWQSWAALAIVVVTLALFIRSQLKRKSGGCGSSGCGPEGCAPEPEEDPPDSKPDDRL